MDTALLLNALLPAALVASALAGPGTRLFWAFSAAYLLLAAYTFLTFGLGGFSSTGYPGYGNILGLYLFLALTLLKRPDLTFFLALAVISGAWVLYLVYLLPLDPIPGMLTNFALVLLTVGLSHRAFARRMSRGVNPSGNPRSRGQK